jgi:hypothetical protein
MKINGTVNPEINPYSYAHLVFNKGSQNKDGKKTALQQILLGKLGMFMQKTEPRSMSYPIQTSTQSGLRTLI